MLFWSISHHSMAGEVRMLCSGAAGLVCWLCLDLHFSTALICVPDEKRQLCSAGQCQGCPCSSSSPALLPAQGFLCCLLIQSLANCWVLIFFFFLCKCFLCPVWGAALAQSELQELLNSCSQWENSYRGIYNPKGDLVIDECKSVITNHCFLQKFSFFSIFSGFFKKQPKPESNIAVAQTNIFQNLPCSVAI